MPEPEQSEDSRRLDWLLTLIWHTAHRDERGYRELRRFKRLRRLLFDSSFPFRGALDRVIEEQTEE